MTDEPVLPPPAQEPKSESEEERERSSPGTRSRLRHAARRLLEEDTATSAKELVGTLVSTSDKAKTELVRAVGREVRAYLEGLGTKELLETLVNDYELEVNARVRLRSLSEEGEDSGKG